ncbi:MAG: hypothetical protein GXZ00_01730 [Synergistaceae bacterium]|nr:hypothetical protein [Synergistaceae bacterium]
MFKRLLVLFLSFGTIIAFGYALGGLGGYMFDQGKPRVIAAGLVGGILSATLAMIIWRTYLNDIDKEDAEIKLQAEKKSQCQFPEEK